MKLMKNTVSIAFAIFALASSSVGFSQNGASKISNKMHSLIELQNGKSFGIDSQTYLVVNGQRVQNPSEKDVRIGDLCTFVQGVRMYADEVSCKRQ
jgi:hypothetical protein